ncbi:MAG: antibiotic biosynthesis monooxygenase family protein [Actinocatenispora sp.]
MFTFINRFTVTGDAVEFERVLGTIGDHMRQQPGFRSARLYRSSRDPQVYVETAEWDDAAAHKKALDADGFRSMMGPLMKLASAEPGGFDLLVEHAAGAHA